jgi:hypothetical protein
MALNGVNLPLGSTQRIKEIIGRTVNVVFYEGSQRRRIIPDSCPNQFRFCLNLQGKLTAAKYISLFSIYFTF